MDNQWSLVYSQNDMAYRLSDGNRRAWFGDADVRDCLNDNGLQFYKALDFTLLKVLVSLGLRPYCVSGSHSAIDVTKVLPQSAKASTYG